MPRGRSDMSAVKIMKWAADAASYRRLQMALCAALLIVAVIPGAAWFISRAEATATRSMGPHTTHTGVVAAVGRIQPKEGVLTIAAPASDLGPAIVTTLQVHEGDWVEAGRTLATLRGYQEFEAALIARQRRIVVAQARLAALKS